MRQVQSRSHPHILKTPKGSLQGLEQRDLSGKPVVYRYTRIPYALPPIGELRWRHPQPLGDDFSFNTSSGSPGDYTSFGAECPQPVYKHGAIYLPNPDSVPPIANVQDEDCLYLNVWVPAGEPPSKKGWPVQFFIHGGWLQIGNAMQSHDYDPFDLIKDTTPRIIVSPTYRLNLFGFLAGAELASLNEDPSPSNFGFWDQRRALEWVAKHIAYFGGDADNISVGGLSAGANSTFFQLNYDSLLPPSQRLIKRIYLWSNAVAIQPSSTTSPVLTSQFNDLCDIFSIPLTSTPKEKMSRLRSIPSRDLIAALSKMKMHTFRASTDEAFIPATFLSSLHSGAFTTRLARDGISVLLGEVSDEKELYKLINPPDSYPALLTQLANYYPEHVVQALLPLYPLPAGRDARNPANWEEVFSQIVADGQVHASERGLAHILLNPPTANPNVKALEPNKVHRYRIAWRPKALDAWVTPKVGVCHGLDATVWWCAGWRADYTAEDRETVKKFLEPFGRFLYGENSIGGSNGKGQGERSLRLLDSQGRIREDVDDELWQRGMTIWDRVWESQKGLVAYEKAGASRL